jgi:hypothetical protein
MAREHGLGRLPAADERDASYPVARLLSAVVDVPVMRYWWPAGWWGNQGTTSQCVAYAWTHWLKDGPVGQPDHEPRPAELYHEAQLVDEWPGTDYDGTSVRAGAKVLRGAGLVTSYWWATTADDVATTVLTIGPVVVGTVWLEGMFTPRRDDGWRLRPRGAVAGGHAYLLNGYSARSGMFRVKNSWGREWGDRGYARLHIGDLARLLADDGEACIALERR